MNREFSVRALVRQVRDDLQTGDRHVIAKETLRRVPREHREAALLQALAEVARLVVTTGHPAMHAIPPSASAQPPVTAGQKNSARSSKVAGIRRIWPQLRATYACLDANKPVGDYTGDDLIFVASHLDVQASRNAAKAQRFRELAVLLGKHKVTTVRELPDAVLAAAFVGEDAA